MRVKRCCTSTVSQSTFFIRSTFYQNSIFYCSYKTFKINEEYNKIVWNIRGVRKPECEGLCCKSDIERFR